MTTGSDGKTVAHGASLGYPAFVWCHAQAGRIGNVVQFHNVPNAVRWRGPQMPLAARLGKARLRRKPSQKTGQTKPEPPKAGGGSVFRQGEYHVCHCA